MEDCKRELHALLGQEKLAGASLLIFANKQDLQGALSSAEIAEVLDLTAMGSRHWEIRGCSAVTGDGRYSLDEKWRSWLLSLAPFLTFQLFRSR